MRRLHAASPRVAAGLLAGLLALGVAAGFLVEQVREPRWQAGTDALVRTWSVDSLLLTGQAATVTAADQADAAVVAVSRTVLERAARELDDGRDWSALALSVTAVPVPTSHFVTITATGADGPAAQRTSEVVAAAFAAVRREDLTAAVSGLTSAQAGEDDPEIRLRGELLARTQPIEVYNTSQPERLVPSTRTPIALGIVGLAVGALVLLALALSRPSITSARDAQRLVALPAVTFPRPGGSPEAARFVARLLERSPNGAGVAARRPSPRPRCALMLCPVTADADKAGTEVLEWIHSRGADAPGRAELVPEPTGLVLGPPPRPDDAVALVLVVPEGTTRQDVTDAVALLGPWHPADAVIVTA